MTLSAGRRLRLTSILLGLLVTANALSARQSPDRWQQLAATLHEVQIANQVPALGLALFDAGQPVLIGGYGAADAQTPFRWGSISKSFTALGVLQLAERGLVDLDAPLRDYVAAGAYVNPWAPAQPVRLIHLLELSAGLSDLSGAEFNDNVPYPLAQALARNASERILRWPPGLQHSYTNVAPGMSAAVIEAVSGRTFEDFMVQSVLQPMGMRTASFLALSGLPGGFKADGRSEIPYWEMTFRAFGALNAPVREMSRFLQLLLNGGKLDGEVVFQPATIERMFAPASTLGARGGLRIGYGAGAYGWVRNGHLFWGHGGDADGYRSRYAVQRTSGRGYLIVINTDNPRLLRRLQKLIEIELTRDLPAGRPPKIIQAHDLERYTGEYYPASSRSGGTRWREGDAAGAQITAAGNSLVFSRGKRRIRLFPVATGRFRRAEDPAVSVVFGRDEAGSWYMQGELGNFVNLSRGPCPGFLEPCIRQ
ncbi:MAG: serine hydrolase [Gammaproteobacteria bacterium]|nr:serine hydrolase [Gammaproteobacteria bacterium]